MLKYSIQIKQNHCHCFGEETKKSGTGKTKTEQELGKLAEEKNLLL